jgi:hypothetical protein
MPWKVPLQGSSAVAGRQGLGTSLGRAGKAPQGLLRSPVGISVSEKGGPVFTAVLIGACHITVLVAGFDRIRLPFRNSCSLQLPAPPASVFFWSWETSMLG